MSSRISTLLMRIRQLKAEKLSALEALWGRPSYSLKVMSNHSLGWTNFKRNPELGDDTVKIPITWNTLVEAASVSALVVSPSPSEKDFVTLPFWILHPAPVLPVMLKPCSLLVWLDFKIHCLHLQRCHFFHLKLPCAGGLIEIKSI